MTERTLGRSWTAQEDELLAQAVAIHGEVDNWKAVALLVPGRTNKACRKASTSLFKGNLRFTRWLHSLSPNVKKTAWTPEEDRLLLDLYQLYPAKWAVIARSIPGRTDDACSKRYREALDPSLKRDEWTSEEDERLLDAYERLGGRWGQVGQELQRSGLGCRNRWRLLERKRTSAPLSDPQGTPASTPINTVPERLSTSREFSGPSAWPAVSMSCDTTPYWEEPFSQDDATPSASLSSHPSQADSHNGAESQSEPEPPPAMRHAQSIPQVADYTPFQYSSSLNAANSSSPRLHTIRYEKSTAVSGQIERQTQLVSTASVPAENNATAVFPHFDFAACSSLPGSSTPPVSQERRWTQEIPQSGIFEDCTRQPPTAPPEVHYFPHQPDHINNTTTSSPRLEPGPSRKSADQYYPPSPSHTAYASFVHRTHVLSKSTSPYAREQIPLDGSSVDTEKSHSYTSRPVSKHRARPAVPRKRPDAQAPLRLSSDLPATPDPSVKPYACGHERCWPTNAASSRACFCTSRGLSDHNKSAHPDDSGGDRPYRCGLEGCGKSWKSINGLQYHLQISKAHFQHAITSTYVTGYISDLSVPASIEASMANGENVKTKKQYLCPHQNCPNRYKQLSGLRYHLAHGHPSDLPAQLDLVPPALSRKLAEKMRFHGSGAQSSETATGPAASQSIGSDATLPAP
ncbi:hypothetical protein F5I97DRAFT_1813546 [Phlebopus sp. FC_14]|nr:hypothetical protein F5I97DRAFT_1813546 [Phlebopus sp. FC_14]